jgi:hypothetical protein
LDNITSDDGRIIYRKMERDDVRSGRTIIKMKKKKIIPLSLSTCQKGGEERDRGRFIQRNGNQLATYRGSNSTAGLLSSGSSTDFLCEKRPIIY